MPVSHAVSSAMTSTDKQVPGLLEVLAQVTGPRRKRGRRYAGEGPQVMATFRNIALSLLRLAGTTEITRTLQSISRDRNRVLNVIPL